MMSMTKEIVDTCELPVTVKTRLGWDDNSKHIDEVADDFRTWASRPSASG